MNRVASDISIIRITSYNVCYTKLLREIAEAIKTVLKNTSLRDSMIEKGLRHAKKFRQQETIPLLYKVYESCLK